MPKETELQHIIETKSFPFILARQLHKRDLWNEKDEAQGMLIGHFNDPRMTGALWTHEGRLFFSPVSFAHTVRHLDEVVKSLQIFLVN